MNAADFAPAEEGVQGNEVEDGAQVHLVFFLSQAALPMRARHLAEGGRWLADEREVRTDRVTRWRCCLPAAPVHLPFPAI